MKLCIIKQSTYKLLSPFFFLGIICCVKNEKGKESTKSAATLFELLSNDRTGITFENTLTSNFDFNILEYDYFYNGGGVAAGDFNNDGLTDLYFTGNQTSSKLYLNKGNFKFEDVTEKAGVNTSNWATGVAVADVNEDGLADIYVCYAGNKEGKRRANQLFINQGIKDEAPWFLEKSKEYGVADTSYSTQTAFFDYDKDGDLDLYIANHDRSKQNPNYPRKKVADGTTMSNDKLYKNEQGKFTEVSKKAGIINEGYSLGVTIADINQDGWLDIYVANDFIFDDLLYINNHDGTFTESIQKYLSHTSRFSMGCDIGDFNNDALPDIMVVDMLPDDSRRQKLMNLAMNNYIVEFAQHIGYLPQYPRNMLQLNNGKDAKGEISFSEIGQLAGIYKTDWSWSVLLADYDNDGWKDIYITNGIPKDVTNKDFTAYRDQLIQSGTDDKKRKTALLEEIEKLAAVDKPNFAFHNNKNLTFKNESKSWGLDTKGFSNGAVYADLDNDGDLDIVTNNINAKPFVFKNRAEEYLKNNYLDFTLSGKYAEGAKVRIKNNGKIQFQENNVCRGFQSTQQNLIHFGLGKDIKIDTVEVIWLDGRYQLLTNVGANQKMELKYNIALPKIKDFNFGEEKISRPVFSDITAKSGLNFTHRENNFEDFNLESLLPHRFSKNGPFVAVGDLDGNGLEDLWIGGPASIVGKLYMQYSAGFVIKDMADPGFEDAGGLFFDADGDKDLDLYVVSGGNEYNPLTAPYQDRLYINDGKGNFLRDKESIPVEFASGSCVIGNDFDKDGDIDLFVGGRVVPNQYALPAESFILINNGKGKFENGTESVCPELKHVGLVTSALWTDFDNDKQTDLIVTGEWMPILFFKNINGKLSSINTGIENKKGWWFSLAQGDFDSDGDIDYVGGNLGLNNKFQASEKHPVSVYTKDFDSNGTIEPIMTYFSNNEEVTVATRDQISERMPSLKKKFNTHSAFAEVTFDKVFTKEELLDATISSANYFATSFIENKGNGKFSLSALPIYAQFSAVQAIQVQDYDDDGKTDIVLGGNYFTPDFMTGRYDASIGLFLKGDGKGNFTPLSTSRSGIHLKGDIRSLVNFHLNKKEVLISVANGGDLQVHAYIF